MAASPASVEPAQASAPEALAQAWNVLARAGQAPQDAVEKALADLGLPTDKRAQSDRCLSPQTRADLLELNCNALLARTALTADVAARLIEHAAGRFEREEALRAVDGNIVLRPAASSDPTSWRRRLDLSTLSDDLLQSIEQEAKQPQAPLAHIGLLSPVQVEKVHATMRRTEENPVFRRQLLVVEEREEQIVESLSLIDLTELISDDATTWFLGASALDAMRSWIDERIDQRLPGRLIAPPGDEGAVVTAQRVAALLQSAREKQVALVTQLTARAEAIHQEVTPISARKRLADAVAGLDMLRIVLCTSRHSTYVRHSVDDLAEELRDLGHEVAIVSEPSASSVITKITYLRAFADRQADLAIIVNFTRSQLGGAIPAQIPCVCWIQDALQHLLTPEVGAAQTDLDLTAGNTMPELFTSFGYSQINAMPFCVPANSKKFHAGPIAKADQKRFDCEIAFVSNHSESLAHMRERLLEEIGRSEASERLMRRADELAALYVKDAATVSMEDRARDDARDAFRKTIGREPAAQELAALIHRIIEPLTGRLFRHQTLDLVARIAEARNWRLAIYGLGWESHATLSKYARGPVHHGESLRACYQSARAHLHIDPVTATHQRVFECAFSGGLPLIRFHHDMLGPAHRATQDRLVESADPESIAPNGDRLYAESSCEQAGQFAAALRALDIDPQPTFRVPADFECQGAYYRERMAAPFNVLRLFGDVSEIVFKDAASAERVLERAIEGGAFRDSKSNELRERMLPLVSVHSFATNLLRHAGRVIGYKELIDWCNEGRPADWRGTNMPSTFDETLRLSGICQEFEGALVEQLRGYF